MTEIQESQKKNRLNFGKNAGRNMGEQNIWRTSRKHAVKIKFTEEILRVMLQGIQGHVS